VLAAKSPVATKARLLSTFTLFGKADALYSRFDSGSEEFDIGLACLASPNPPAISLLFSTGAFVSVLKIWLLRQNIGSYDKVRCEISSLRPWF
jgi:hypothetical protein